MGMRIVVAALAVLACAAPPAAALTRVASGQDLRDPQLAAADVVYVKTTPYRDSEGQQLVMAAGTHRAPRMLYRALPRKSYRFDWLYLTVVTASTPDHLTVSREDYADNGEPIDIFRVYTRRELRGVSMAGTAAEWTRACAVEPDARRGYVVAASGDALVSYAPGCTDQGLLVRLFSQRGAVVRRLGDAYPDTPFGLAGPYVAYEDSDHALVVTDWRTGQRVYRAEVPGFAAGNNGGMAVQADGKVALAASIGAGCGGRAAWLSPVEPTLHELPVPTCDGGVRIAGDRIAFTREVNGLHELATSDLAGGDLVPVALSRVRYEGFDFDGGRLAWNVRRCHDYAIYVADVRPGRPAPPGRIDCPLHIVRRPLRLGKRGEVRLPVRCPAGCYVGTGSVVPRGGLPADLLRETAIAPGSGELVFRVANEDRRRVTRRGSVSADVELEVYPPTGPSRTHRATLRLLSRSRTARG